MALFENELVDYLVTKGVITAGGTDGFVNQLPDVAGDVLAIKQTGGIPSKGTPDPWIGMQVLCRSDTKYYTARVMAAGVYTYFHEMINATTNTYRIIASKATTFPQSLGEDERHRYLMSCHFLFNVVALDQSGDNDDGDGYGGKKDPIWDFEEE